MSWEIISSIGRFTPAAQRGSSTGIAGLTQCGWGRRAFSWIYTSKKNRLEPGIKPYRLKRSLFGCCPLIVVLLSTVNSSYTGLCFRICVEPPTRGQNNLKSEVRYDRSTIILQQDLTSPARLKLSLSCCDPLQWCCYRRAAHILLCLRC